MDSIQQLLEGVVASSHVVEILKTLKTNDILDLSTFGELLERNDDEIKTIIPSIGLRAQLRKKYRSLASDKAFNQEERSIIGLVNDDGSITLQSSNDNIEFSEETNGTSAECEKLDPVIEDPCEAHIQLELQEPPPKKKKINKRLLQFDLKKVLQDDAVGQTLLKIYEGTQDFTDKCQGNLCQVITTHFLNNYSKNLQNEDFDEIVNEIVALFPEECKETYYVPPVLKRDSLSNKSKVSKGKLVDKYRNTLTFIRQGCSDVKNSNAECNNPVENKELTIAASSKEWLIHNRHPWEDVVKHWSSSYSLRLKECGTGENRTLHGLFEEWPILTASIGHVLIERDFSSKYEPHDNNLITKWNGFFENLLDLRQEHLTTPCDQLLLKLLQDGTLKQDNQDVLRIYLLASLVSPKSNKCIKQKGKKTYWKPSVAECREGLVLHVKLPGDIEKAIEEKHEKMRQFGLRVQPFVIIVGPELASIKKVYVCIDRQLCNVSSVLKALDVAFKTFIAYDVQYPPESEHIWYLLQWGVYDIQTTLDNKIPFIFNLLNKLKKNRSKV